MIVEFIDKFGDETKIGAVLNYWFDEDVNQRMYEIISEWSVFYIPENYIVSFIDQEK